VFFFFFFWKGVLNVYFFEKKGKLRDDHDAGAPPGVGLGGWNSFMVH